MERLFVYGKFYREFQIINLESTENGTKIETKQKKSTNKKKSKFSKNQNKDFTTRLFLIEPNYIVVDTNGDICEEMNLFHILGSVFWVQFHKLQKISTSNVILEEFVNSSLITIQFIEPKLKDLIKDFETVVQSFCDCLNIYFGKALVELYSNMYHELLELSNSLRSETVDDRQECLLSKKKIFDSCMQELVTHLKTLEEEIIKSEILKNYKCSNRLTSLQFLVTEHENVYYKKFYEVQSEIDKIKESETKILVNEII